MGKQQKFDYGTRAPVRTWRPIVDDAATQIPNVYSASFFARRFISIPDQQVRAFNLCFALARTGKIKKESRVAIVGAGISGMTCAVALAMLKGCQVLVFERDSHLLRRFREAPFRFVHPDMNASTDSDAANFHPRKRTNFAFMNWCANRAPAVADEICRKFDHYRSTSAISLHLKENIRDITLLNGGPALLFQEGSEINADVVILATGFGNEKKSEATNDASYWHSGDASQYQPTSLRQSGKIAKGSGIPTEKERVVISGNGDSAVIELAHFLIKDFRHEMVAQMLPSNDMAPHLGLDFAQRVENLWFRQIEFHEDEEGQLQGPLSWYWWMRGLRQSNPQVWQSVGSGLARPYLEKLYVVFDQELSSFEKAEVLPRKLLRVLENVTDPILDELASLEIDNLMNTYVSEQLPIPKEGVFRDDFEVHIIGPTPKMYSRRQAPQNWFVLFYLKTYGTFNYQSGRFRVAGFRDGRIAYMLRERDEKLLTDRLVVRQGPDYDSLTYQPSLAKLDSSQYRLTHLRNLEHEPTSSGERYYDAFITAFRTRRWHKSVKTLSAFSDYRENEEPLDSPDSMQRKLDDCLLDLIRMGRSELACELYRKAKGTANAARRLSALEEMLRLQLEEITMRESTGRSASGFRKLGD